MHYLLEEFENTSSHLNVDRKKFEKRAFRK